MLVHCLTEKGRGYPAAEQDQADHFHTVGAMDPLTCAPLSPAEIAGRVAAALACTGPDGPA